MLFLLVVAKVIHLLSVLSKCTVCQGNSDEHFVSLPSIQNNVMRNQSSKKIFLQCVATYLADILGTSIIATLNLTLTGSLSI